MPSTVFARVAREIDYADNRFGPFRSTHEGLGVLTEEYDELKDAIRTNDLEQVAREACQVAAVAMRIAMSLDLAETRDRSLKEQPGTSGLGRCHQRRSSRPTGDIDHLTTARTPRVGQKPKPRQPWKR